MVKDENIEPRDAREARLRAADKGAKEKPSGPSAQRPRIHEENPGIDEQMRRNVERSREERGRE